MRHYKSKNILIGIAIILTTLLLFVIPSIGKDMVEVIKWLSTSLLTNEQLSWIPIVFLAVWQGIAYSVLIYLAGLQTIDDEIYEAAAIDGVNAWQKFWKITFPLIGPFFTINLVLRLERRTFLPLSAPTPFNGDFRRPAAVSLLRLLLF